MSARELWARWWPRLSVAIDVVLVFYASAGVAAFHGLRPPLWVPLLIPAPFVALWLGRELRDLVRGWRAGSAYVMHEEPEALVEVVSVVRNTKEVS